MSKLEPPQLRVGTLLRLPQRQDRSIGHSGSARQSQLRPQCLRALPRRALVPGGTPGCSGGPGDLPATTTSTSREAPRGPAAVAPRGAEIPRWGTFPVPLDIQREYRLLLTEWLVRAHPDQLRALDLA